MFILVRLVEGAVILLEDVSQLICRREGAVLAGGTWHQATALFDCVISKRNPVFSVSMNYSSNRPH